MIKAVITMYFWGGERFGFKIKSSCEECDINRGILEDMERKELRGSPLTIEIKPWLTHLWEALRHGGWHVPVVIVSGRLFSQGVLLDREKLAKQLQNERTKSN